MANMLEGGGKTPMMRPEQLEKMGFKVGLYAARMARQLRHSAPVSAFSSTGMDMGRGRGEE
eukprot:357713-Chlamydomonas_euryale.AAC.28